MHKFLVESSQEEMMLHVGQYCVIDQTLFHVQRTHNFEAPIVANNKFRRRSTGNGMIAFIVGGNSNFMFE